MSVVAATAEFCDQFRILGGSEDTAVICSEFNAVISDRIMACGDVDESVKFTRVCHDFGSSRDAGVSDNRFLGEQRPDNGVCNCRTGGTCIYSADNDGVFKPGECGDIFAEHCGGSGGKHRILRADLMRTVLSVAGDGKYFPPA